MNFLVNLGTILVVALVPLLVYALRAAKADFDLVTFVYLNRSRLTVGLLMTLAMSFIVSFVPEAKDALALIGVNTGQSAAAVGLAIGAFVVSALPGDK